MSRRRTAGVAVFSVFLTVFLFAQSAGATTISFTPSPIGVPLQNTNVDMFSNGLNGTLLTGQAMSLDLIFTNELLGRITLLNANEFDLVLTVFTNAPGEPGFAGAGSTGFLINPNGGQLGSSIEAGRSQGNDGTFDLGLVTFSPSSFGGANVIDISGVHFDTSLPTSGFAVTNTRLRFTPNSNQMLFGTAAQLPESSTLALLVAGISFAGLMTYRRVASER